MAIPSVIKYANKENHTKGDRSENATIRNKLNAFPKFGSGIITFSHSGFVILICIFPSTGNFFLA